MLSEQRGSASARRLRVGCVCACFCMSALAVNFARGESVPVSSYDQWQMNGFTRSPFVPTVTYSDGTSASAISMYSRAAAQAVVPIVASLAESAVAATAAATGAGVATLSGYVYCDYDGDGVRSEADWGIAEATVLLSMVGSSDAPMTVLTARDGSYTFVNLATGSYTVKVLSPSSSPGSPAPGFITDDSGNIVPNVNGTTSDLTTITNVQLAGGDSAIDYDFPQGEYPVQLLSKRMLLNIDPGIPHTPPSTPVPVPEPSTWALLIVAGLFLSRSRLLRRR